jgi:hypothetical protein
MTALLAGLGSEDTGALIEAYCRAHPPEPFAAVEAAGFSSFLSERLPALRRVSCFEEVLAFERAMVCATVYGSDTDLIWSVDPVSIFASLDTGVLPAPVTRTRIAMQIRPT